MDQKNRTVKPFSMLVLLLVLVIGRARAQDSTAALSLPEAIEAAIRENRQVGIAKTDERIAGAQLKQTDAIWLPQLNLSYAGMITNQPLAAFGFKLQQSQVQASDFNPALLNKPGNTGNIMTQLSLQQPLYNADLMAQRKAAALQVEMYGFQTRRTEAAITMQVTNTYLQLDYTYTVVKVLEEALSTVKDIERFTRDRFAQGLLQKSDLLNVEVQVKTAETNLAEAKSQLTLLSDQLSLLMNRPGGRVYTTSPVKLTGAENGTDSVPSGRSDLLAMKAGLAAYDQAIRSTKLSVIPRLNGFANYQLNDKALLGFGSGAYIAGLQLSWDIFKGNQARNKAATQALEKNKLQQQLQQQVDQGTIEIRKARQQLADLQYRQQQTASAIAAASESLRIMQNRYGQGLVNTTDVLMAQTQLAQQKMLAAQTDFMQQSTINYLNFLTESK